MRKELEMLCLNKSSIQWGGQFEEESTLGNIRVPEKIIVAFPIYFPKATSQMGITKWSFTSLQMNPREPKQVLHSHEKRARIVVFKQVLN